MTNGLIFTLIGHRGSPAGKAPLAMDVLFLVKMASGTTRCVVVMRNMLRSVRIPKVNRYNRNTIFRCMEPWIIIYYTILQTLNHFVNPSRLEWFSIFANRYRPIVEKLQNINQGSSQRRWFLVMLGVGVGEAWGGGGVGEGWTRFHWGTRNPTVWVRCIRSFKRTRDDKLPPTVTVFNPGSPANILRWRACCYVYYYILL